MLAKPVIAAALLCLGASPLWAQSAVDRANSNDRGAIEYRKAHCAPGNEAACARANEKNKGAIDYRNQHATAEQKDPDAALTRANEKDQRSVAYRKAHCASDNKAACARANAKTDRAMTKRDAQIDHK